MIVSRLLLRPVTFVRLRPGRPHIPCRVRLFTSVPVGAVTSQVTPSYALELLRQSSDLHDIRKLYPSLLTAMKEASTEPDPAQHFGIEDVKLVMASLASSGRPQDMRAIDDIIQDLLPQLKIEASLDIYAAVLDGLIKKGDIHAVALWLTRTSSDLRPDQGHFHHALQNLKFASLDELALFMRQLRLEARYGANEDTVRIAWESHWNIYTRQGRMASEDEAIALLDRFRGLHQAWNQETHDTIYNLYADAGRVDLAERISDMYKRRALAVVLEPEYQQELERLEKLKAGGLSQVLESLPPNDGTRESRVLRYRIGRMLLGDFRSVADLRRIDQVLPEGATRRWTVVIRDLLQNDELDEALKVYQEFRTTNFAMDAAMVGALLQYMGYRSPEADSDRMLRTSLAVYQDFVDYADSHPSVRPGGYHSRTPDLSIYRILFRWLARHPNLAEYHSTIDRLISDMSRFQVKPVPSLSASIIAISMRTASSPEVALDAYREGRHLLRSNGDAYVAVLVAFCNRCFNSSNFFKHAAKDYFTIVRDMQRANVTPTPRVYTVLLTTIGHTASRLKRTRGLTPENLEYLISTTRRVHDQLTLDPTLTPTPIVLSQLINTYQRLGCLGDAYRVWELMFLTGSLTPHAISNILDGCGHAGDLFTARAVWNKLVKEHFPFDVKHWETYIECLCRIGEVREAASVLAKMPTTFDKTTSTRLVLNWAKKYGKFVDITPSTEFRSKSRTINENNSQ
ncbi:hypothetical protein BKA70DRAFT_319114 [Coprinopsis sp. MPI-PUGE-AT-0042]|nr:hypothetical protein BKA70DRAFT_319114 [Coprinopsis sp. MPI-PUGE-AT-0042]